MQFSASNNAEMTSNIELDNVTFERGGQAVLAAIDATIVSGESTAIVGKSGCGKTTLLRLAAGFLEPTSGTIRVSSKTPHEHRQTSRVGFLFQEPRLWKKLTVDQTIRKTLSLRDDEVSQPAIEDLLLRLNLAHARKKYPSQLSMGMKARLAIAQEFCAPPELLFADEPFASIDEILRKDLNVMLRELLTQSGTTAVWVTHSIVEALQFADRVIVLSGTPATVIKSINIKDGERITHPASLSPDNLALHDEILRYL